jgi:hypothetical protein
LLLVAGLCCPRQRVEVPSDNDSLRSLRPAH